MNQVIHGFADSLFLPKGSGCKKASTSSSELPFGELLNAQAELAKENDEEVVMASLVGSVCFPIESGAPPEPDNGDDRALITGMKAKTSVPNGAVASEEIANKEIANREIVNKGTAMKKIANIKTTNMETTSVETANMETMNSGAGNKETVNKEAALHLENEETKKPSELETNEAFMWQDVQPLKTLENTNAQARLQKTPIPEVSLPELPKVIEQKLEQNIHDFEIKLRAAHLGEVTIKATYDSQGRTQVSVVCKEVAALKVLTQEAPALAGMIQNRLGVPCQVVAESPAPDYLEQNHQQNQQEGQQQEQGKKRHENHDDDFLQQLRLGLL